MFTNKNEYQTEVVILKLIAHQTGIKLLPSHEYFGYAMWLKWLLVDVWEQTSEHSEFMRLMGLKALSQVPMVMDNFNTVETDKVWRDEPAEQSVKKQKTEQKLERQSWHAFMVCLQARHNEQQPRGVRKDFNAPLNEPDVFDKVIHAWLRRNKVEQASVAVMFSTSGVYSIGNPNIARAFVYTMPRSHAHVGITRSIYNEHVRSHLLTPNISWVWAHDFLSLATCSEFILGTVDRHIPLMVVSIDNGTNPDVVLETILGNKDRLVVGLDSLIRNTHMKVKVHTELELLNLLTGQGVMAGKRNVSTLLSLEIELDKNAITQIMTTLNTPEPPEQEE